MTINYLSMILGVELLLTASVHTLAANDDGTTNKVDRELHAKMMDCWEQNDFEMLDRLFESGGRVDCPMVVGDSNGVLALDSIGHRSVNFATFATLNWNQRPELFELAIRYSSQMDSSTGRGATLAHDLALGSDKSVGLGSTENAMLYFPDISLLAINGVKVNARNDDGKSAFELIADRIIRSNRMISEKESRVYISLKMFSFLSTVDDRILPSNTSRAAGYFTGNRTGRLLLPALDNALVKHPPKAIPALQARNYSPRDGITCNRWFFKGNYVNPEHDRFATLFNPYIVDNYDRRRNLFGALPNEPLWLDSFGTSGLTVAFQAYASFDLEGVEELFIRGASADIVLRSAIYDQLLPEEIGWVSPALCPRKGDTLLLAASLDPLRRLDLIPMLLKYTASPDARDLLNRNALHRFLYHRVQDEQKHLVKMLIEAGVDVNARSVSGNTPCHIATNRNAHLILELVGAGADLYAKNAQGDTPIDLLRRSISEDWVFSEQNKQVLSDLESKGFR